MTRLALVPAVLLLSAAPLRAQTGTAPVLTTPPDAIYPVEASKGHIGGEAVVAFSIDPSGKTAKVHAVSGPDLLTHELAAEIRGWRFVTPLPRDAESDFVADYTYSIVEVKDQVGDTPLKATVAGGADLVPGPIAAISGVVRSVDNRQTIDATPRAKAAAAHGQS